MTVEIEKALPYFAEDGVRITPSCIPYIGSFKCVYSLSFGTEVAVQIESDIMKLLLSLVKFYRINEIQ